MFAVRMIISRRTLLFGLVVLMVIFISPEYSGAKPPLVRVKVAQTTSEFFILPDKYVQVTCYNKGEKVAEYHAHTGLTLLLRSGKILLEEAKGILETELDQLFLIPRRSNSYVSINGKKYRGNLRISLEDGSISMIGVNEVSLENYLRGVVPLEIGIKLITSKRDREALKVQAVAARTYALSKLGQYPDRPYDLESTVADQVYGGVANEEKIINRAIKQTAGEVLTNNRQLVKAYFHANCGGQTEFIEKAWPWKPAEEYLLARSDSEYCSWAPNYAWQESLSKAEAEEGISGYLASLFKDSTYQCGSLQDLQIMERSGSGRIQLLKVITDRGEWEVKSDSIRWCFRRNAPKGAILPSTKFEIGVVKSELGEVFSVEFTGNGNGHGVGMCQIGALGRARAGQSYRQILLHYYPGTKLVKRY